MPICLLVQWVVGRVRHVVSRLFPFFWEYQKACSRCRKCWSKKGLGIGLKDFWSQKKSQYRSRKFWCQKVAVSQIAKSHWLQLYDFSPEWVSKCLFKLHGWTDAKSHWLLLKKKFLLVELSLQTSWYPDFFHLFESIGLKTLVKKVSKSQKVPQDCGLKKNLRVGLKIFDLNNKSQFWSQNFGLVTQWGLVGFTVGFTMQCVFMHNLQLALSAKDKLTVLFLSLQCAHVCL